MSSQQTEQTAAADLAGYADLVADEYGQQLTDHAETPDVTPPPALLDIVDARATVAGVQADDAALVAAVRAAFGRRGWDMPDLAYE